MINKLSIIVPVYNTEKYLGKCLDSLVNQSLQEIEIIIVNDGSTDKSGDICKNYQREFPDKIIYFEQPNKGVAAARNLAIENVSTPYLTFLDSDDEVCPEIYLKCLENIEKKNLDLIGFEYEEIIELSNGNVSRFISHYSDKLSNLNSLNSADVNHLVSFAVWNKIYKTSIFRDNNITFFDIKAGEDTYTNQLFFCYVNSFEFINLIGIKYYRRDDSLSKICHTPNIIALKKLGIKLLIEELNKRDLFIIHKKYFFVMLFADCFISTYPSHFNHKTEKVNYYKELFILFKHTFGFNFDDYKVLLPLKFRFMLKLFELQWFGLVIFITDVILKSKAINYFKKKQLI